jgi:hypothetical protein
MKTKIATILMSVTLILIMALMAGCERTNPDPTVDSVSISPSDVSVGRGYTQRFRATVSGLNDPSQSVTWSVIGGTASSINATGLLTVDTGETVGTTLTVRATSTFDNTKSGTATVSVTAGGVGGNPTITIQNNTSRHLHQGWIKPSSTTEWTQISPNMPSGQSQEFTLPHPLSTHNVYDFRFTNWHDGGFTYIKFGVTVINGGTITFMNSDLNDESMYPKITIRNRTGINLNGSYIKPSSADNWGVNFGAIQNNHDLAITIPIPPTNFTVFDIQLRHSDASLPSTLTKTDMTITDGMVVTFVSTDVDGDNSNLPVIVIQNNTSHHFSWGQIKPSSTTEWTQIWPNMPSGQSEAITLSQHLSTHNVYDLRFARFGGNESFVKFGVTITNGGTIIFTNSDLE